MCICGLAKERETALGDKRVDRVYLPHQKNRFRYAPIASGCSSSRERATRRIALQIGVARRSQAPAIASQLETGLAKTRKALLTSLGSVQGIKAASDEQTLSVPG